MGDNDELLNIMMAETLRDNRNEDGIERSITLEDPSELESYFLSKVSQNAIMFLEDLGYFYRLKKEDKILDFPKNYSIFSSLGESQNSHFSVDKAENPDFLFEILKEFIGNAMSFTIRKTNENSIEISFKVEFSQAVA